MHLISEIGTKLRLPGSLMLYKSKTRPRWNCKQNVDRPTR